MSPSKNIWIATLGLGSLWAWSYALFPSAGLTTPFAETSAVLNLPDWFMSLVVGTAVYLVVAFCGRPALFERGGALLALLGTAAQTVCAVCMLMPAHPGVLDAASGAAFGAAAGLLWPCWFDVLGAMETEDSERVFVFALAMITPLFVLMSEAPGLVRTTLLFALAFVQLGAYWILVQQRGQMSRNDISAAKEPWPSPAVLKTQLAHTGVMRMSLCCATAFAFVAFADSCFTYSAIACLEASYWLFSIGMILGAGLLALFIHFSPRIDVFESIRWVFPILAFALVLGMLDQSTPVAVAVMLMALCHIAFEGMTRLGILATAKRSKTAFIQVAALGLASISAGAYVGGMVFRLCSMWVPDAFVLCAFALAALVALVLILFNGHDSVQKPPAPLPNEALSMIMAKRYALSPRETEILGYLIEGRSAPFIRDELHISKGTVDTHVRHIYEKTGVSSKQDLITLANTVRSQSEV